MSISSGSEIPSSERIWAAANLRLSTLFAPPLRVLQRDQLLNDPVEVFVRNLFEIAKLPGKHRLGLLLHTTQHRLQQFSLPGHGGRDIEPHLIDGLASELQLLTGLI